MQRLFAWLWYRRVSASERWESLLCLFERPLRNSKHRRDLRRGLRHFSLNAECLEYVRFFGVSNAVGVSYYNADETRLWENQFSSFVFLMRQGFLLSWDEHIRLQVLQTFSRYQWAFWCVRGIKKKTLVAKGGGAESSEWDLAKDCSRKRGFCTQPVALSRHGRLKTICCLSAKGVTTP